MSGPPKRKCQSNGFFEDLLPRADTRQRGIDQHKTCTAVAMERGKGVPNHVADIMGDERDPLDPQHVQHAGDVPALRFLVVTAGGLGRQTHTAEIRDDDRPVTRQVLCKRHPHVARLAIAMQQHNCWSRASNAYMQFCSIRCDVLSTEALGEGEFGVCSSGCHEIPLLAGLAPGLPPLVVNWRLRHGIRLSGNQMRNLGRAGHMETGDRVLQETVRVGDALVLAQVFEP
jgi:hypothetical protein